MKLVHVSHAQLMFTDSHDCSFMQLRCTCADPESFVRGGPALTTFFKLMRRGRIQVPL